jgi:predicted house-cleaning noncanonical NTP pyrophosphatase (MazG superfamily)
MKFRLLLIISLLCNIVDTKYIEATTNNSSNEIPMRKFKQNKLWRDKLIEIMENECGSRIHWRYLNDVEFNEKLREKLLEEAQEVITAQNRNALIEELADLFEVVDTLSSTNGISKDEIIAAQTKKREERGGFASKRFVETAEHPVNSFGEKYCLADPIKYPEIFD